VSEIYNILSENVLNYPVYILIFGLMGLRNIAPSPMQLLLAVINVFKNKVCSQFSHD